ncbi:MAG: carboxypeptidase M32 [Alphaproteobacteria bacterium]|nr:carboxypeptidase M32 [Alphaproteobacteria bacterium]
MTPAYAALEARFRRLAALEGAGGILHWDRATMMPPGGAEARAEQLATLQVIAHEILTAPDTADLLARAAGEPGLDAWQQANMREMRRRWVHATAVPSRLVEALSKATSACEMTWREARKASDYACVKPQLQAVLDLVREAAAAKAAALGVTPYDALLDQFDPDQRAARIDAVFARLEAFLPGFVGRVIEKQAREEQPRVPAGPFPVKTQRKVGLALMRAAGFDFERGRLDVSAHPFCGGGPDDIRITTRYDEADFSRALMGVLHETGHALYELGLPRDWQTQPVGSARGMTLHESQSLLVEMQACRSPQFLAYAAPVLRAAFAPTAPADDPAWSADNLARLYTRVQRTLIRVDADEATYPLHVMLRYRLETAMLAGDLALSDLPGAWTEGMRKLVGVAPPDDAQGCLQDIHWYDGAFGYFPTYTLGAMAAAQLYDAAKRADARIEAAIAAGDFRPLLAWLRPNVHAKGSLLGTDALLERATGRPLDASIYLAHLERRYLGA